MAGEMYGMGDLGGGDPGAQDWLGTLDPNLLERQRRMRPTLRGALGGGVGVPAPTSVAPPPLTHRPDPNAPPPISIAPTPATMPVQPTLRSGTQPGPVSTPAPTLRHGREPFIGDPNWDEYSKWEYDKDVLQKENPNMTEAEAEHVLTSRHGQQVARAQDPPMLHQYRQTLAQGSPQLHGWKKGLDIAGQILKPGIEERIPGTPGEYAARLRGLGGLAEEEGKLGLQQAQIGEQQALAQSHLREPADKMTVSPHPEEAEGGVWKYNQETNDWDWRPGEGGKTVKPEAQPKPTDKVVHSYTGEDQKEHVIMQRPDNTTYEQVEGKVYEKPDKAAAEPGTWAIDEDAGGKPVLFNSKTGATRAAPAGVQKPGTYQKGVDAANKILEPVYAARDYAQTYVGRGAFTGPGDEALMEKFFEVAKPSTGFRMSQPQIDMLRTAQSWMNSAQAKIRHATTGVWFSDELRQQIAKTMGDLAASKERAVRLGGAGRGAGAAPPALTPGGGGAAGTNPNDPLGIL